MIAEVKRRSPVGGLARREAEDVARARAYERGRREPISVLVEPHWFGGSIDDLRRGPRPRACRSWPRSSWSIPGSCPCSAQRARMPCSCWPHSTGRRAGAARPAALDLGLEPLVEVHDARELDAALTTDARLIGVNNRDLRTLARGHRNGRPLRARSRTIASASPSRVSATRRCSPLAGAGLRCGAHRREPHALRRPGRGRRRVRGRRPRPGRPRGGRSDADGEDLRRHRPAGLAAAVAAGADAIGLNMVPGTKRALECPRRRRSPGTPGRRGERVGPAHDRGCHGRRGRSVCSDRGRLDLDAVQLSGREAPAELGCHPLPVYKVLHLPATGAGRLDAAAAAAVDAGRAYSQPAPSGHPARHGRPSVPGGTGTRVAAKLAAVVARELPVILAGGLDPPTWPRQCWTIPAIGVDMAGGVERPRGAGHGPQGPCPRRPVRQAGVRCRARGPTPRPCAATPVHAGLLEADADGRWGIERDFGGRYVPETLMAALEQLEHAYAAVRHDRRSGRSW